MAEPAKPAPKRSPKQRVERDGELSSKGAVVDAAKLLDRLAEVTSEAERAAVRLETEQSKGQSLQAALKKERALRDKAERALAQAKTSGAELAAKLEAERSARKQAQNELQRVDKKAAILEQQVNLTWSQLKVSEGEQRPRWWRPDS